MWGESIYRSRKQLRWRVEREADFHLTNAPDKCRIFILSRPSPDPYKPFCVDIETTDDFEKYSE
jgi:hypothetical protein